MYVIVKTKNERLWTVGYWLQVQKIGGMDQVWHPHKDFRNVFDAEDCCSYLNGGLPGSSAWRTA